MTTLGFTSNYVARLEESRCRLDDFVEINKRAADCRVNDLKKVQASEQQSIDSLLRHLKSLQYERGVAATSGNGSNGNATSGIVVQRKKIESMQVKVEEELSMLKSKYRIEQSQLDEVLAEEAAFRKKADEVRAKKEEIEMARGITLEDLTKGLLNYRFTGLTFERSEKGALSFKFTRLDKDDPKRPFTFILSVDENNDYELSNINPPLNKSKTDPVLETLNADGKNGFNLFAVGMRKLFKETIE